MNFVDRLHLSSSFAKLGAALSVFTALLLIVTLVVPRFAFSANEVIPNVADKLADAGEAIAITDLTINGDGNDVLNVTLYVPRGSFAFGDTTGLTFVASSSETGNNLKFSGTRSALNAAFTTLEYTAPFVGGTYEIEVLIDEGDGSVYRHANGHVYKVVEVEGGITWTAAKEAAEEQTYPGSNGILNGYLATIADVDENDFVLARIDQDGWIGASDDSDLTLQYENLNEGDNEGEWFWVTGPEAGTKFWTGGLNGTTTPGQYANWNKVNPSNEPNNSGAGEDCAEMRFSSNGNGRWNDLSCSTTRPNYVVEFGEPGNEPIVKRETFNVTVAAPEFTPIEQCFTVTQPGLYGLVQNITGVEGDCIVIEANDVVIEGNGFSISGTVDNTGTAIKSNAALEDDRSNIEIRNVTINNFDTGVWTNKTANVEIDNITVTGSRMSLWVEGEQEDGLEFFDTVSVTNSTFRNNKGGISVDVMRNITISGNTIEDTEDIDEEHGRGVWVWYGENVVVNNNTVSTTSDDGIYLSDVHTAEITHNIISGAGGDGIDLSSYEGGSTNVTISHNQISDISDRGIEIEYVDGGLVEHNTISSYDNAIEIDDSGSFTVRNNSFTSTDDWVVYIKNTDSATLLENHIIGNEWVYVDAGNTSNIVFSQNGIGNSYFLLDETPAWEIFDIKDNNNNGYADVGADLPFADGLSYTAEGEVFSNKGQLQEWQDYRFNYEDGDAYLYDGNEATGFAMDSVGRVDIIYSFDEAPSSPNFNIVHNGGTSVVTIPTQCVVYSVWQEMYLVPVSIQVTPADGRIDIRCGEDYSEGMHIYDDFVEGITGLGSEITVYEAWLTYENGSSFSLWEGGSQDAHPATQVIISSGGNNGGGRSSGGTSGGRVGNRTTAANNSVSDFINQNRSLFIAAHNAGIVLPAALLAMLGLESNAKTPGLCAAYTFTRDLQFGDRGEDVRALQRFLNCSGFSLGTSGPGAAGEETEYFVERTRASVIRFQEAYRSDILTPIGLTSGTGIFSSYSRAKAHSLMAN